MIETGQTISANVSESDTNEEGGTSKIVSSPLTTIVGITTQLVHSSLWSVGGQGAMLLASLIATPFVIRMLGSEAYGVLALINVLIGYLAFTDLGMGLASTWFSAGAHARGDDSGEVTIVWTSVIVGFIPVTLVALVLFLSANILVEQVFRLPSHLQNEAALVLRVTSIGFIARNLSGVFNSPQLVRMRLDLYTLINAGTGVGQICLVPIVLLLRGGLSGAVVVITGVNVIAALAHVYVSSRLQPQLLRPRINLSYIWPLFRFGITVVASSMVLTVLAGSGTLLLTRFAPVTAIAHYSVATTLTSVLAIVPTALNQSLLPAFSRLQAMSDRGPLHRLYQTSLRGCLFWIAPIAFLICVGARPFLTVWAGSEYGQESTLPAYILVCGLAFNVMAYVPGILLLTSNKAHLVTRCYLCELLPYLLCSALFINWFGAFGAALAWSLRTIADSILLFIIARHVSGISFSPLTKSRLAYLAAVAILLLGFLLIVSCKLHPGVVASIGFIATMAYGGLIWSSVLTGEERAGLDKFMRATLRMLNGNSIA